MNPEIEKLIDLALKDGQITEKEREIILRKAETLGLDKDEIEMILEGIISDQNKAREIGKTKQGVVKKCPHCGAPAKAFSDKCDSCGGDFRFNTLSNLTEKLTSDSESNVIKISRQNIPINKEELIEFATYSFGNANNAALGLPERNAWYSKFKEAKNKLKLSYQLEFNPFKSDSNIPFMGNLIDNAKQIQLENELSGQDIKDIENAKKLDEELKQEWKKPTTWIGLVFAGLIMYGMYKIIIMIIK
jgi:hypothetical protein